jgi:hypothetical protein
MSLPILLAPSLGAGVEEFPNIEAVQKYMAALHELNWDRYTEATSLLGTKLEP